MIRYRCDNCGDAIVDTMVVSTIYGPGLLYCEPCAEQLELERDMADFFFMRDKWASAS